MMMLRLRGDECQSCEVAKFASQFIHGIGRVDLTAIDFGEAEDFGFGVMTTGEEEKFDEVGT